MKSNGVREVTVKERPQHPDVYEMEVIYEKYYPELLARLHSMFDDGARRMTAQGTISEESIQILTQIGNLIGLINLRVRNFARTPNVFLKIG